MRIFHNKFSKVLFSIYLFLTIIFIFQDIIADTSFFDFSGLGIYLLSYPLITVADTFVNINTDSSLVLYSFFVVSTFIYYFIIDLIPFWLKTSSQKKSS